MCTQAARCAVLPAPHLALCSDDVSSARYPATTRPACNGAHKGTCYMYKTQCTAAACNHKRRRWLAA